MTEKVEKGLVARLVEVKRMVGGVSKAERTTSGQQFNFRGIDAVVNAVADELIDQGIVVIPEVLTCDSEFVVYGNNNAKGFRTQVKVQYTYFYGDESLTGIASGEAIDSGDKSTAKAMSVAFRTFLLQSLTLPTDERDPDHDQYNVNGKGRDHDQKDSTEDDMPAFTPMQLTVIENKVFGAMDRDEKKSFVTKSVGHHVDNLRELSDEDCITVVKELNAHA